MASSPTIRILSAGAVKEGVGRSAERFGRDTGMAHAVEFATAPAIVERIRAGDDSVDVIVLPRAQVDALVAAGKVSADGIAIVGSVTMAIAVKNGASEPDLGSVATFTASVLAAGRIVYNTASSGQYVATVLERLGLADRIADKVTVVDTGKAILEALAADTTGEAIGFAQATEIRLHEHLGIHLVGPLPGEIAQETVYAAGVAADAGKAEGARRLIAFMASPAGQEIFRAAGVLAVG